MQLPPYMHQSLFSGSPMLLSVCFVTRNEEQSLGRALASVRDLAQQVIVADTGSTDATVAIARQAGAEVLAFPWNDDFAAARNFALEQATGDWILWLNPDEELQQTTHGLFRECLARQTAFGYFCLVQQVNEPGRPEECVETQEFRLFRRRPEIRYAGRTHPHFVTRPEEIARAEGMALHPSAITIRRHAYQSVATTAKLQWAARLLAKELDDRPGQLYYLIEYGRTLLLLHNPTGHEVLAEAAKSVRDSSQLPHAPIPHVQVLLEYLLTDASAHVPVALDADQAWELGRRWFPNSAPLLWAQASRLFHRDKYRESADCLERLLLLGKTGSYDKTNPFDWRIVGERAMMNLGACYTRLGQLDRAEACFRSLLSSDSLHRQATQNLAILAQLRSQTQPSPASGWFAFDAPGGFSC
jgi:hypothetical protein